MLFLFKGLILLYYVISQWVKSPYVILSIVAVIALQQFLDLALDVVLRDDITYYDELIVQFLNKIAVPLTTTLFMWITAFASIEFITGFTAFGILVLGIFRRLWFTTLLLLISTGGGAVVMCLSKMLFQRERPVVGTPIIQEVLYSFPSGHAMMAVCFYGLLIYLAFCHIKRLSLKIFITVSLIILILLIGLSRIYLGVHYPSDVLGGVYLGLFWLSLTILICKRLWHPKASY